ncbi:MAG: PQQ-like beta-propeller repeat protein [Opitutaceae bacterium]|jgi:outer membrane protein assembly factor BamB|nr:PQQ-like beta-propeller repeat protein [Opitutaceae bacterium]
MNAKDILVLGQGKYIVAFNRKNGVRLWQRKLATFWQQGFINVVADSEQVYVQAQGELYCLSLFTGEVLWKDPLKGMGNGIGTLALAGEGGRKTVTASQAAELQARQRNAMMVVAASSSASALR